MKKGDFDIAAIIDPTREVEPFYNYVDFANCIASQHGWLHLNGSAT